MPAFIYPNPRVFAKATGGYTQIQTSQSMQYIQSSVVEMIWFSFKPVYMLWDFFVHSYIKYNEDNMAFWGLVDLNLNAAEHIITCFDC